MKCPNCGFSFSEGYRCPTCDIDVYIFSKTQNMSIRLYNEALDMAKGLELTHAIDNLEQCLLFDKSNINARNLLGLLYCETGRIGDALKHWIISTSYRSENNAATTYMDFLQKNARDMEKANDAVCMYNKALHYLRQGSDDLAIIQLKTAIENNADFIDAYNLMTLCCIEEKNYKRAQYFVDLVLKRDVKNDVALHYRQLIDENMPSTSLLKVDRHHSEVQPKTISVNKTDSSPPMPRYKRKEKRNANVIERRDLVSLGIGIVATAIILLVMIFPAINENKDNTIAQLEKQLNSYTGETNMTAEEVLAMRTEYETLLTENKLLRSEETKQANLELLQTAVSLLTDEKFEECVDTLNTIETLGFSEEDLSKYNSIRSTAYPKAADSYYTKGKSEFLSNNFTEAKVSLQNALSCAGNENFVDDIYYYLGKIAESEDNTIEAKIHYEKVISDFPDSNQIDNVKNAMSQLPEE